MSRIKERLGHFNRYLGVLQVFFVLVSVLFLASCASVQKSTSKETVIDTTLAAPAPSSAPTVAPGEPRQGFQQEAKGSVNS